MKARKFDGNILRKQSNTLSITKTILIGKSSFFFVFFSQLKKGAPDGQTRTATLKKKTVTTVRAWNAL